MNYVALKKNVCFCISGGKFPNSTDKKRMSREPSGKRTKKEAEADKDPNLESDEEAPATEG